jgi:spore coat polysaccharide biosynthesis protein SpsF
MARNKTAAIIQTRTGSTRLPGKAAKLICGKTLTELIIERVKKTCAEEVIAAIPEKENDDFVAMLEKAGAYVFKGSEENVLSRFHGAAAHHGVDIIARIPGDDPLIHPGFIDEAIKMLRRENADYVNVENAPLGCGVDIFTFAALDRAFHLADLTASEKEHVIPVFFRPGLFRRVPVVVTGELARPDLRLTLDTMEDFRVITAIYEDLYSPPDIVELKKAIDFLDSHRDVLSINKNVKQKGWSV